MVLLKNVTIRKEERILFSRVNQKFEGGRIYGIMGENSTGKTLLLNCLAGYAKIDSGTIIYDTYNINIGYLEAKEQHYHYSTVEEYLHFFFPADNKTLRSLCEKFDIPLKSKAESLSKSKKKILEFIKLMNNKNELLLLDGLFDGLDSASIQVIVDHLKPISTQCTIIITSNSFLPLTKSCDTLLFIADLSLNLKKPSEVSGIAPQSYIE